MDVRFQKELNSWKKIAFLNPHNLTEEESKDLPIRYGTRTVLINENNKVILIRVEKENFSTLVGGGIEDGEEIEEGMIRECKEESGYDVSILAKLGYIELWRKKYKRYVFGFLAKTNSIASDLKLTNEEKELGHHVCECSFDEAIKIISNNIENTSNLASKRSIMFLEEAKNHLENMVK